MYFVFFFKQKTAYEMRISDWSSDVCSSDLVERRLALSLHPAAGPEILVERRYAGLRIAQIGDDLLQHGDHHRLILPEIQFRRGRLGRRRGGQRPHQFLGGQGRRLDARSEEHTSELQSIMRISYAVFCLKKNTQTSRQSFT